MHALQSASLVLLPVGLSVQRRTSVYKLAELYLRNKVEIYFAGTELMMADFFTKPVDKTKFLECRDYLLTRAE